MTELHTYSTTQSHDHAAPGRRRRFLRHYVEMVVAMFLGMAVLGVPAGWALGAVGSGWSELNNDAPALMLLGMLAAMLLRLDEYTQHHAHHRRDEFGAAAAF